ncbi:MAG: tetratricopeptide repeat protein [Ktedonobacteraceae bacterium]|nr:tetratricopeptide repeat protein [Ktedonobacteraceae bacterium]
MGPEHPGTATSLNNLALLYSNQGNYEEALPLYQRALAIYKKVLGPDHPNTILVQNSYTLLQQEIQNKKSANSEEGSQ